MKAIELDGYGDVEVLRTVTVEPPTPGPGQVLVSVRAAGVDPVDAKLRAGVLAEQMPLSFPHRLGSEVAGTVVAVSPEDSTVGGEGSGAGAAVGDEVFGWSESGGYAELSTMGTWAPLPPGLGAAEGAGLPVAGEAALRALDHLDLAPDETLLVHGAAGAVGSIVVQLALASGVRVVGTAADDDLDLVAGDGATPVRYGTGFTDRVRAAGHERVDAVLDTSGAGVLEESWGLRPSRMATLADPAAFGTEVAFLAGTADDRSVARLDRLSRAVADGLRVAPARPLDLDDAREAHRLLATGGRGRIVLVP